MTETERSSTLVKVFVPFAVGYFLSYLSRVVNAVIAPDLVKDLGLDAAQLGLLTSAYFLAFAAFQIPLGVLLDRFGPRRTNAGLLVIAAAGAAIFAAADSVAGLAVGRGLMGLGVSGALMAGFKAFSMWFRVGQLPLVNGCQLAAGGFGALMGTVPVEAALGVLGWRGVFVVLSISFLIGAVAVMFMVPRRGMGIPEGSLLEQFRGFGRVFASPLFIRIAPMTIAAQASFVGIQSLWSGPWLADVAGMGRGAVADYLLLIACAMIVGFLITGSIAERLGRRGVKTIDVALFGMACFIASQVVLVVQWQGAVLLTWMAFGFFGTANLLCYAMLTQSFPIDMVGRVNTSLNLMVFAGAFLCQWSIGLIIDLFEPTATGGYAPGGYRAGFGIMLALEIATMAWYWIYRRTDIKA